MRILLADDNPDHCRLLTHLLLHHVEGSAVTTVETGADFVARITSERFDVGLLDFHLADCDANEVLKTLGHAPSVPPIIVLSHDDSSETVISALRSGGRDFLPKSQAFDPNVLLPRIADALKRQRVEQQLIERQRDESLAVLAGGIAHDFNNILVVILGRVAELQAPLSPQTPAWEGCNEIQRAAQRLADLARQLLAYAHGGKYRPTRVDLNAAIRDALAMLQGTIKPGIRLRHLPAPELWPIQADQAQLVQVILNLCINACEAMGEGGTLSVSSENVHKSAPWSCLFPDDGSPGDYAHAVVADTGCGIAPSVLLRIFEPYYSTKGDGRGLGLAAVKGIMKNHDGLIDVVSTAGTGTAFHLYFPRSVRLQPQEPPPGPDAARRASEVLDVLVVEDEPLVQMVMCQILRARGHRVTAAGNLHDAVQLFHEAQGRLDTVVLDMRLPDGSGADFLSAVGPSLPDTRVVICSGYDRDETLQAVLGSSAAIPFLPKPFTPAQLVQAVERLGVSGCRDSDKTG
jgi:two-component system cell cycle sensor histidine kinase/response regulator CckA